jgi:hypothetical protein
MNNDWRKWLPDEIGKLPLGGVLRRTEANGSPQARIALLGIYPAATRWQTFARNGMTLKLPVEVESHSFESSSRSGGDLDIKYFNLLGIARDDVLMLDLVPYFFANTSKAKVSSRSMWENIQVYTQLTGEKTAVQPRPAEDDLLQLCRTMPGNMDRLAEYLSSPELQLLITLGRESAAFVRGHEHAADGQQHLYADLDPIELFGRKIAVVHLVHPGQLQRGNEWKERNESWCKTTGRDLMKTILE